MPARSDLDLESLRLLLAVVETGSLSGAAARVGISQPAASARIREFEARWRLPVLRRTSRGSRLTTDGEAVAAWAQEVVHAADTMQASLEALSNRRKAGVVVAASLTVAEHLVPRWLGELHARHPDVRPVLQVINSEAVADAVRDRTADVGFIESARLPAGLTHRTVGHDRLVVVVAPGHPWARRRTPLTTAELVAADWVLREEGSGTRTTFEAALGGEPRIALEAASTTALVGSAVAGMGPAVVSAMSVRNDLERGRLAAVPTELDLRRPLTAVWRSGERLVDAADTLVVIAAASVPD
ncbi:LysR family transcriptional regulator [Nocardioides panacisoli]|uniref:LysR family transcriptional regulator n=1 Tax=Nocardioides panacisoli TaxID=627624 RepID=UPI001C63457F|nr:LysR family transcriptional regulator [Nocardioides panacisoli]QYJ03221.1 LysR family transcriptional regulator [Nocardioides panacisoli]